MQKSTAVNKDIRTQGFVLKRTNYGEADRILNIITPEGKVAAIAKGVRKARSRLAGGVEMFTLADLNLHFGKSEMGTVTGAKMVRHYGGIVKDLSRMELAGMILKKVDRLAESSDNPDYFKIVDTGLMYLEKGASMELTEAWCLLNLKKAAGEEMNLYREVNGEKLDVEKLYEWNAAEEAFQESRNGRFGASEIKMLRLMLATGLDTMQRVQCDKKTMREVITLARIV